MAYGSEAFWVEGPRSWDAPVFDGSGLTDCRDELTTVMQLFIGQGETRRKVVSSPSPRTEVAALKETLEEGCCFLRETNDFVGRLAIEFEIQLGLRAAIVPVGKTV